MSLALAALFVYPVKSLAGGPVSRARVEDRGLRHDRRFMVVDADGRFVTQRERPAMATSTARVEGEALWLEREGAAPASVPIEVEGPSREVRVWGDRCRAVDAGDEAAGWLSEALRQPVRLVRMPRRTRRPADPGHAREGDVVSFADGFPFLLATEASLEAVNARLDAPVDMRRFRPNLVVRGGAAFAEDAWRGLRIGDVRFEVRKPCSRCAIVDVDPDSGERAGGVLAALATFRERGNAVFFGQNLVHDGEGELRVGAPVELLD